MNKEPGDWRVATDPWNKYWVLATSRLTTEVAGSLHEICYSQMLPRTQTDVYGQEQTGRQKDGLCPAFQEDQITAPCISWTVQEAKDNRLSWA